MSTDASAAVADASVEVKKTRKRRGRKGGLKSDYPVPEEGLTAVPVDWSYKSHGMLKPDDFAGDTLLYKQWRVNALGQEVSDLNAEIETLKGLSAPVRSAMSTVLGSLGTAGNALSSAFAAATSDEEKAALAAKVQAEVARIMSQSG